VMSPCMAGSTLTCISYVEVTKSNARKWHLSTASTDGPNGKYGQHSCATTRACRVHIVPCTEGKTRTRQAIRAHAHHTSSAHRVQQRRFARVRAEHKFSPSSHSRKPLQSGSIPAHPGTPKTLNCLASVTQFWQGVCTCVLATNRRSATL